MGADSRLRPVLIGLLLVAVGVAVRAWFVDVLIRTTGTWIGTPPPGASGDG